MMFAPFEAITKKKRVLVEVCAAVVVSSLLLCAAFFASVGGGSRKSKILRRELRKVDGVLKAREHLWKNQPLTNFMDPHTINLKEENKEQHDIITKTVVNGSPYDFQVHPKNGGASAIFSPSEIMIEVLNPQPFCVYSVTILSHNFYTGTAMLLAEGQFTTDACGPLDLRTCHLVYSWKPILPGQYNVLVHEIDTSHGKTPLIQLPYPFLVTELVIGASMSMLEERILNHAPLSNSD